MSVINSVLRDLDRKPSAFTPLEADTVLALDDKGNYKKFYWAVLSVVVILLVIFYWFGYYDNASPELIDQNVEISLNESDPIKVNQQSESKIVDDFVATKTVSSVTAPERNQISGLQIKENEAFMELTFRLNEFTPSFLKQRSNNRYVFIIKKVANSIVTPQISDNPWLEQIRIVTLEEDVEIRFDTQPGVLVDTLERREGGSYYWLIRLKKSLEVEQATVVKESDSVVSESSVMNAQAVDSFDNSITNSQQSLQQKELDEAPVKLQIRPVQNKNTAKMKLNAAIQMAKSGDTAVARKELEMLLGGKFDREVRIHLLELLSRQNDGEGFSSLLVNSLKKYPQDQVFVLYEANRLFAEKQYLALIEKLKNHTKNDQLLSLLATSYQRTEQHQQAAEYFIAALKMNPQQPRLWISLGISQQYLAQREQALSSYQMALRSGSVNQRLHDFVQSKIKQLSN
jgi:tetratricopeptide (TPR) repeat protein